MRNRRSLPHALRRYALWCALLLGDWGIPQAHAQDSAASGPRFSLSPNIGLTYQSISHSGTEENDNLQWLGTLQSRLDIDGDPYAFSGSLFLQYGQSITSDAPPRKVQDDLILSLMPSMALNSSLGIRLFLETTAETNMSPGRVDSIESNFLDPLFLYQTVFLGQQIMRDGGENGTHFELVYGVGYAFQQTITNHFVLAQNRKFIFDNTNPLSRVQDQVTVESGYSGIVHLDYHTPISDNVAFNGSVKIAAFTKNPAPEKLQDSRVGGLLLAGLQYKIFSLDYTMHVVYDRNISPRRQLDQTMIVGLKFTI